jgi:hypothetical protein
MNCAAFIAYPFPIMVNTYGVEFAQDSAAFSTDADNCLTAIPAKDIFFFALRVFPHGNIFCVIA